LIGTTITKTVGAGRGVGLAYVEIAFHPFEAGGDLVFAVNFRQGDVGVTILAGIDEVVVIGGAANSATVVVESMNGSCLTTCCAASAAGKPTVVPFTEPRFVISVFKYDGGPPCFS